MTTASASSTLNGEDKDARTTVLDAARPRARGSDRAGDGADARASMTAASIDPLVLAGRARVFYCKLSSWSSSVTNSAEVPRWWWWEGGSVAPDARDGAASKAGSMTGGPGMAPGGGGGGADGGGGEGEGSVVGTRPESAYP
jgi:hypothetical protein